jgi:hypothetical protein
VRVLGAGGATTTSATGAASHRSAGRPGREQVGDLAAGKRDHPWWGMLVAFGARHDDQEGVGEHGQ